MVLISNMFTNPTPVVLRITDEVYAKNHINWNTIIAKIKHIMKL